MAIAEPWTAILDTPNKSIRQNVPRRGVVLHHAALTSLDYLRRLCMGEKQVSATGICKDRNLEKLMTNAYRAWSLSDAYWDSALRSVETCNESTDGWTISDASHWSLAYAVAYWASVDGFWPHRDGDPTTWTVIGHREVYTIHGGSYATACPGGMDLNLVTTRAQSILKGMFLMALTDAQQNELYTKTRALYDAVFMQTETSRGTPQGVLGTLGLIYANGVQLNYTEIAAALAPMLIEALGGSENVPGLTAADVESAMRRVFASAGTSV